MRPTMTPGPVDCAVASAPVSDGTFWHARVAIVALDGVASVMRRESPARAMIGGDATLTPTESSNGWKTPILTAPAGTLSIRKSPDASVRADRLVPSTTTSALASGVSCRLSITIPEMRANRLACAALLSCARAVPAPASIITTGGTTDRARRSQSSRAASAVRERRVTLPAGEDLEPPLASDTGPLERIRIIDFCHNVAEDIEARGHARAEHRRITRCVRTPRQHRVARAGPRQAAVEERRDLRRQIRKVDESVLAHAQQRDPHLRVDDADPAAFESGE